MSKIVSAADVAKILNEEWPKAVRHPADYHCQGVAVAINYIRQVETAAIQRPRRRKSNIDSIAGKFLKQLDVHRAQYEQNREPLLETFDAYLPVVDAVRDSVQKFLERRVAAPPRDPAGHLAGKILEAWRQAGVPAGRGTRPDDPMCRAVTQALRLAGLPYTPNTVSDMLRGRARRRRNGAASPRGGALLLSESAPPGAQNAPQVPLATT